MPKGADLHLHYLGADYAENVIEIGARNDLCVHPKTMMVGPGPCAAPSIPLNLVKRDQELNDMVVKALSLRGFQGNLEARRQHVQEVTDRLRALMIDKSTHLASLCRQAARENTSLIEILLRDDEAGVILEQLSMDLDMREMPEERWARLAPLLKDVLKDTGRRLKRMQQQAGFRPPNATAPGIKAGFLYSIPRTVSNRHFFVEAAFAFALAAESPVVVGVSLGGDEAHVNAVANFSRQMVILAFFHEKFPSVKRAYHAGELAPGRVSPEHLGTHIEETFRVAGADRIGHAADIGSADKMHQLLTGLAAKKTAVEVALTANEQLLGLAGPAHPLPLFVRYKVPVVLTADRPGIFRTDLTEQFILAATRYPQLGYKDFKRMVRNSLEYSFLEGQSLWPNGDYTEPAWSFLPEAGNKPSEACRRFLKENPKAAAQWRLEKDLRRFEESQAGRIAAERN
ncbi:MAG: hypothetical protein QNK37_35485 [Acidobacteriota bacterium]|nr:hypothetical protein [Acidobacteriota bacterium]